MRVVTCLMAGCAVSLLGVAAAQQPETSDQAREGIPVTQHQEEALRDIDSQAVRMLDKDGDGSISRQEAEGEPSLSARWGEYDRNSDDVLDSTEIAALEQSQPESAGSFEEDVEIARGEVTEEGLPSTQHQREVTQQDHPSGHEAGGAQQPASGGLVERLDTDGDGAISQSEAQGSTRLVEEWDQLDRNSDGKLDSSELGGIVE
ncbi:MAG: hypothetical protein LOD94_11235 [Gammaproteobacteria bacterium]